ncbi:Auxin-responsive protein IAA28 [Raphanus sativus]|uniref:Auxin-responsive protein n=1 Tax=Raphanus sativus TaxID=3726 RepID=A0A9W3DGL7_RAPSA|nr:auxin-responsive protein IAA28 [Raphanus sativus]XP_056862949.1 auxin-responsive protein IAA28 [Raphanus sativus]XP_056862950.1 auxin-responsive protein IAA28 [Raphanus sativus]XP_056862951.1 auxin-responsive protein IAA28 [Raphanus sativus]KAJ4900590.1 Auxin-responsive protein IAA28 [Raphanus sativus]
MEEEKRLELRLAPPCHQLTSNNINGPKQRNLAKETPFVSSNRVEAAPVVGWPPVRSSRRYLTAQLKEEIKKIESDEERELYVKINMEGVPIGRKVNLSAYNNYQQLSHAVDQLFSKKDSSDLNRQYTLVYEDTEGDKVLVGDVPWEMFVSTVKRLHVLKSSHVSMLSPRKHGKE